MKLRTLPLAYNPTKWYKLRELKSLCRDVDYPEAWAEMLWVETNVRTAGKPWDVSSLMTYLGNYHMTLKGKEKIDSWAELLTSFGISQDGPLVAW